MNARRNERRALRAQRAAYFRTDADGREMIVRASSWLKSKPGFDSTPFALRRAVVLELRGRDKCQFATFGDRDAGGGVHLVDQCGEPLSLEILVAARARVKLKGAFNG